MYKIDFQCPVHVHFIGIGGISMSGLAEILLKEHFTVTGSDSKESPLTRHLTDLGAVIHYGQKAENITDDIDVVVYTAAVHADNPEFIAAKEHQLPMLTRAELLGQLMTNYKTPIAVSGTHGKIIGGNIRVGHSDVFITEACEYTNSFLDFLPKIGIILNVEEDHMDFFKDLDDIRHSFHRFAALLPKDGTLIINSEISQYEQIIAGLNCNVITYGIHHDADYTAQNIQYDNMGNVSFDLIDHGTKKDRIFLSVNGEHNVSNALSAIITGTLLGIDLEKIKKGLLSFTGTDRRFEYKGTLDGVTIIDDYAHHPTEIEATLSAAQHYPHREIWCIFQPHTYTRTKAFFHEFAQALTLADHVILADIYAARETDTLGMSSEALSDAIRELGGDSYYFSSFDEIKNFVKEKCIHGDMLITMGAGDVVNIGESLLSI